MYKNFLDIKVPNGFLPIINEKIKYDYYYISNKGEIFSRPNNKILKQQTNKDGYKTIILRDNDLLPRRWTIHKLVALVYIGNPPKYINNPTIDHKNNIRDDNRVENLQWIEHSINSSERTIKPIGEKNGRSILNENKVKKIWQLIKQNKYSASQIGNMFGVNKGTILDIKNKKNWKYLTDTL